MQIFLPSKSIAFALSLLKLATLSMGSPIAEETFSHHMSAERLRHWLANTDAKIEYIGEPINPLTSRSTLDTTVTYCPLRTGNSCAGECLIYVGGATCLNTLNTQCLSATQDVSFCDQRGCTGNCKKFSECEIPLNNGFCATPGIMSISVE